MSNIEKSPSHRLPTPGEVLSRAALPLFLFMSVLLFLLLLSWYLLLPRLTAVEVEGSVRSAPELVSYHQALVERIEEKEHQRDQLIIPLAGSLFSELLTAEENQFPLSVIQSTLEDVAADVASDVEATVVMIDTLHYDPSQKIVKLSGDVRNVGPRSMTVLAQFLESIRSLPFVMSVESLRFVRDEHPVIGQHSPYTFTLHLQ